MKGPVPVVDLDRYLRFRRMAQLCTIEECRKIFERQSQNIRPRFEIVTANRRSLRHRGCE